MTIRNLVGIVLAALLIVGCGKQKGDDPANKKDSQPGAKEQPEGQPKRDSDSGKEPERKPDPIPVEEPGPKVDFSVTAEELAKEFTANEGAAQAKYGRTMVRITGKVAKVKKDRIGVTIVELVGTTEMPIECGIPSDSVEKANALKEGQTTTVVGGCYGKLGNSVSVDGCKFVK